MSRRICQLIFLYKFLYLGYHGCMEKRNAYEKEAVARVAARAREREGAHLAYIEGLGLNVDEIIGRMLSCPVTLNFHPDRYAAGGLTVIESLVACGAYRGQFETGTTNGGRTAWVGGDRYLWEQKLFCGAYPQDIRRRPKYGALNLFCDLDGACARFGSCFLTLHPAALSRCTFAYGDSSSNPDILCTADTFSGVAAALLRDVVENGRLLNRENVSLEAACGVIAASPVPEIGRNLDNSIEVHMHGEVFLGDDVDALHLDASFRGTSVERHARALCAAYGVSLCWIPERRLMTAEIGDDFRGPMMIPLAERIDRLCGGGGFVNAARIGTASRLSVDEPEDWRDLGDEPQLFQFFKQIWHTVAYFGRPSSPGADEFQVLQ